MDSLSSLLLMGAGEEWKTMPWKVWLSPSYQWEALPTFLLCEYGYRATCWLALLHALRTDRLKSWICGVTNGTFNDIFFMFMPFCDNFWQAQATVMITPRLPLYICEMYASVMYYPSVAASIFSRYAHLPPTAQACLTGLLAHLFYGVYDVNGPKYLWWTWHDSDPAIQERQANAPYGSSLWILTYCGLQSFLNAWMLRGPGATVRGKVPPTAWDLSAVSNLTALLAWLPLPAGVASGVASGSKAAGAGAGGGGGGGGMLRSAIALAVRVLHTLAGRVDGLQAFLNKAPDVVQILFRGVVATPVFMILMGICQVFSFDVLGIPGKRTYYFTVAAMALHVLRSAWLGRAHRRAAGNRPTGSGLPAAYTPWNWLFLAAVVGHFALFTALNACGTPEAHVSTGIHQQVKAVPSTQYDIMGWPREEELPPGGPHVNSHHDYAFQPDGPEAAAALAAGGAGARAEILSKTVPLQQAAPDGPAAHWYSIYGKVQDDGGAALRVGKIMASLGVAAFCLALRKDL